MEIFILIIGKGLPFCLICAANFLLWSTYNLLCYHISSWFIDWLTCCSMFYQLNSRIPSATFPVGPGNNAKTPPKKPSIGQKKPLESLGSSPPLSRWENLFSNTAGWRFWSFGANKFLPHHYQPYLKSLTYSWDLWQ